MSKYRFQIYRQRNPYTITLYALVSQTSIAEQKFVLEKLDKPRLIVLTDIENESDDVMSIVRLMTYANVLDIESIVATTSCWQRNTIAGWRVPEIVDAYGKVWDNLLKHKPGYSSLRHIKGHIKKGIPAFAGNTIQDIIHITAKPEETVRLSFTSSIDPDGDRISYRWFQYREAGTLPAKLKIETTTKSRCPSRLATFQDKAHSTSSWKRMMMASQVCVVIVGLLSQSSLEQREG